MLAIFAKDLLTIPFLGGAANYEPEALGGFN